MPNETPVRTHDKTLYHPYVALATSPRSMSDVVHYLTAEYFLPNKSKIVAAGGEVVES